MNPETWLAVDAYYDSLLVRGEAVLDAALDAAQAAAAAAGLPAIAVSPAFGKCLSLLAGAVGATRVLEVGTLGGYSTLWLARGMPPGGRIVTLEIDPHHAAVARASFARAGYDRAIDVRLGPALETLPALAAEGGKPFDLVFIDADKEHNADYFEWALRMSRPGTVIIVDNAVRGGTVANAATTDPSALGVRRVADLIAAEPRVRATVLQTVGAKGYDGFILALVAW